MAIAEFVSGTEAVSTTEHSMVTDSAGPDAESQDGVYQLWLDLSDMVAADELQIRIYDTTAAAQHIIYQSNLVGVQAPPIWVSPTFVLTAGWDMTLDALAGTITVTWSIRSVT
jgi:hypothetical protein